MLAAQRFTVSWVCWLPEYCSRATAATATQFESQLNLGDMLASLKAKGILSGVSNTPVNGSHEYAPPPRITKLQQLDLEAFHVRR